MQYPACYFILTPRETRRWQLNAISFLKLCQGKPVGAMPQAFSSVSYRVLRCFVLVLARLTSSVYASGTRVANAVPFMQSNILLSQCSEKQHDGNIFIIVISVYFDTVMPFSIQFQQSKLQRKPSSYYIIVYSFLKYIQRSGFIADFVAVNKYHIATDYFFNLAFSNGFMRSVAYCLQQMGGWMHFRSSLQS